MFKVYTFGDFDIRLDNHTILKPSGYPYKVIKLFKYLLTFKGRKLLPENIIEDLWPENDFKDPKNVLRTQISRVRRMINTGKVHFDTFYNIDYINGYYLFEVADNCVIDFEIFNDLINQGNIIRDSQPDEAFFLLKEGLSLYKGEFLQEIEYDDWIIPVRNKYQRIYLKGLLSYLELLKDREMYREIVEKCEETIQLLPYEEMLHVYFIEALMEMGEKRYAISHYEYITGKIYNDLRINPSSKMKELYRKLKSNDNGLGDALNFKIINTELGLGYENEDVLICEPYYLRFLYNLEIRKKQRNIESKVVLGIISIENKMSAPLSEENIKNAMKILIDIISKNMRKGDVLSKWNDSQLVSLLYGVEEENISAITNRLKHKFGVQIDDKNIMLNIRYKPL